MSASPFNMGILSRISKFKDTDAKLVKQGNKPCDYRRNSYHLGNYQANAKVGYPLKKLFRVMLEQRRLLPLSSSCFGSYSAQICCCNYERIMHEAKVVVAGDERFTMVLEGPRGLSST
jgi:hypothetical protein